MKINYIQEVENIASVSIDYFICCSGYENRSSHFFKKNLSLFEKCKKICFLFKDRKKHSRTENDKLYSNNKFIFKDAISNQLDDYLTIIEDIFHEEKRKEINVVIDFSSMTTVIYAALLKYFNVIDCKYLIANLFFCYTPAEHTPPKENASNSLSINKPISIFETIQSTDKKIALIIGLGYEKDKALGLYEYFQNDKKDTYLFITKNSHDDPFYKSTVKNNDDLIKIVDKEKIIHYAINNMQYLISTLDSLVSYLIASNKRVVIAPTGSKQFALASLIVNLSHKEITTYRISYGEKKTPDDLKANKNFKPIISLVNFKTK